MKFTSQILGWIEQAVSIATSENRTSIFQADDSTIVTGYPDGSFKIETF